MDGYRSRIRGSKEGLARFRKKTQHQETNDMHVLEEIMQHENVPPEVDEISVCEEAEVTPSDGC